MNISLRQLRVFAAVVRHMSYTRAAEELHLTQPAVSMQVRQLEEELGLPLFEKLGRGIALTEAGRELYPYSQGIDRSLRELQDVMESLKGVSRGRLSVAVASTVNYFAPKLLAAFHHRYPGIALALDVTNREQLVRLLEANAVDLVLMGQPPAGVEVEAEVFMDNPLVVVAPPDHPLAGAQDIPLTRLADEVFVMREPGSGTRQAMERFLSDRGVSFRTGMQMTRNEAIKQSVRAGLGLSVVSIHTIELELLTQKLVILDVSGFPIQRQWYLVYRQGKRLSPSARAFRQFVLSEARQLAAETPGWMPAAASTPAAA
ncbi:MAG: LysR family transcriptional regulator [Gammaproteobacteria bacterium]|jgi:DNA-binding transcriptional LysR family regulator|nr:LysR family transcriptional regulator [Gammaproteobacteria bacterium]